MSALRKASTAVALALLLAVPAAAQTCPSGYRPANTQDGQLCIKDMEADFRNHLRNVIDDITWELEENEDCQYIKEYAETVFEWKLRNGIQVFEFSSSTARPGFHEVDHNPNYHWLLNRTSLRPRNRWGLAQMTVVHEITHHLFGEFPESRARNAQQDCIIR